MGNAKLFEELAKLSGLGLETLKKELSVHSKKLEKNVEDLNESELRTVIAFYLSETLAQRHPAGPIWDAAADDDIEDEYLG